MLHTIAILTESANKRQKVVRKQHTRDQKTSHGQTFPKGGSVKR